MNRDLQGLRYAAAMDSAITIVKGWVDKTDNKEAKEVLTSLTDIFIYNSGLELERRTFDSLIDEYKSERNRAIMRARRAEEKLEPLQKENTKLKNSLEAFTS